MPKNGRNKINNIFECDKQYFKGFIIKINGIIEINPKNNGWFSYIYITVLIRSL